MSDPRNLLPDDQRTVDAEGIDPDIKTEPDTEERDDEERTNDGREDDTSMQV